MKTSNLSKPSSIHPFVPSNRSSVNERRLKNLTALALAMVATLVSFTSSFAAVSVEMVLIGDPDNPADPLGKDAYGRVNYAFSIAKNETTISEYAQFLNAVAKTDTYQLYSTNMTAPANNGISRSGSSGNYTYSVNPGSGNKPINWVSWFDAARFTNWLHNGQPGGAQDAASTEDGAYTLAGAMSGVIARNGGARFWIPSENEWYKAAYYDPNKGGAGIGGYWSQATQSNSLAGNVIGVADSANYNNAGWFFQAYTDVGAYGTNSQSAFGTND
ncbi:MAG: SUMF1/EgtB/PvdO family nonheme iron enzyme, partial [Akkermansiaceae bacterium]|nr:SUMF1/EgtB/PvdO family nonheme iron enzyme [Akkermansiaceae bacterium]